MSTQKIQKTRKPVSKTDCPAHLVHLEFTQSEPQCQDKEKMIACRPVKGKRCTAAGTRAKAVPYDSSTSPLFFPAARREARAEPGLSPSLRPVYSGEHNE